MEEKRMLYKTRTAFGQSENIGIYALVSAVNELMAEGVDVPQISVRYLLPLHGQKPHLYEMKKRTNRFCREQGLKVEEICWEKNACVSRYGAVATAAGLAPEEQEWYRETMRAGQDIVLVNQVGIEGTLRIMEEKGDDLKKRFSPAFLDGIAGFRKEALISGWLDEARNIGVSGMCQIGEGGIFAELWRLAEETGMGLDTDIKKMPVRQETIEICEYFRLNPYQLSSAGSFLVTADHGEALADMLLQRGVEAAVIGSLTDNHDKIIRNGEERRFIDRPAPDELNKIFMEETYERH